MNLRKTLYQEIILEHNSNPSNFGALDSHTHQHLGYNALCGDKLMIYMNIQDGMVKEVAFNGDGCAISKASTSILTEIIAGQSVDFAQNIIALYIDLITRPEPLSDEDKEILAKLSIFEGIRDFPERGKCALLSARTMESIFNSEN